MGQSREAARRVLPSSDRRESSKKGVLPAGNGRKRLGGAEGANGDLGI